jgi:hypothetical protein
MTSLFMKRFLPTWFLACSLATAFQATGFCQPYSFSTFAGSNGTGGSTDGTNAQARFTAPSGVTVDTGGVVFVTDANAIRKATRSGSNWVVTTLAGTIQFHGSNDGTNAVARFNYPQGITVDNGGALYVADSYNNAIRKVTPAGTNWVVTTIAGVAGTLTSGWADGTNGNARFDNPYGVALDNNANLYVADTGNSVIRKITAAGTNWVVSTVAGTAGLIGSLDGTNDLARFNHPAALAVGGDGTIYISDFANHTIRKMRLFGTNWAVTTLAGLGGSPGSTDGLGNAAKFNQPLGLAVEQGGYLDLVDSANNTLRRISPAGQTTTIGGIPGFAGGIDGVGTAARFNAPAGLGLDSTNRLYVADGLNFSLRQGQLVAWLQLAKLGNQIVLSWPTGMTGFLPQGTALAPGSSWTNLNNPVGTAGEYFVQTNSYQPGAAAYRLSK